jgi:hypothetical protein
MSRNQPTGSVTGRTGWEWNRLQAAESATGTTTTRESDQAQHTTTETGTVQSVNQTTRTTATEHRCSYRDENIELRRRVQQLEAELERRDRHLQSVIDHYERILADQQTRQSPEAFDEANRHSSESTADDQLPPILSRLLEYAESR